MNKLYKVAFISVVVLGMPFLAAAQVTGNTTVDVQIQSLLSQITSLEQQLKSLVQSTAPSSTPPMWNASSTPPAGMQGGSGMGMGGCPSFGRNLSVGSQGSDVMQLQQMLSGDGFFSASSTGFFGSLTAGALDKFQTTFGISTSSGGFFGPITRAFVGAHCGGQGGGMGSSTPPMTWNGTSTRPMPPPQPGNGWMGTSTNGHMMEEMGSSTPPRPCPENSDQGAAAALFVPHVILPMFLMNPCGAPPSASQ